MARFLGEQQETITVTKYLRSKMDEREDKTRRLVSACTHHVHLRLLMRLAYRLFEPHCERAPELEPLYL